MKLATLVIPALVLCAWAAPAAEPPLRLQGLFCNTEAQVDALLAMVDAGASPYAALTTVNGELQACTDADLIAYVLTDPVELGQARRDGIRKYRAQLVGVEVGGAMRPVDPPALVFFFRAEPLAAARIPS